MKKLDEEGRLQLYIALLSMQKRIIEVVQQLVLDPHVSEQNQETLRYFLTLFEQGTPVAQALTVLDLPMRARLLILNTESRDSLSDRCFDLLMEYLYYQVILAEQP